MNYPAKLGIALSIQREWTQVIDDISGISHVTNFVQNLAGDHVLAHDREQLLGRF